MRRRSELAVWGGVMAAMEKCRRSQSPVASLGEFLGELRTLGWHPADIRSVERDAIELLRYVREQQMGGSLPEYQTLTDIPIEGQLQLAH